MSDDRRASPEDGGDVLEAGEIAFFFRPTVDEDHPHGLPDVQRFFIVLRRRSDALFRLLVVGRKRLPEVASHERVWGFVDTATRDPGAIRAELSEQTYETRTRGVRRRPPARAVGEGAYAISLAAAQLHLTYALDLPEAPHEAQAAFRIAPEASFVLSIKNPEAGSPPGAGLEEGAEADYPERLQREFRGRRFEGEDARLLDFKGAEFILVGASVRPVEDDGRAVRSSVAESRARADLVRELRLDPRRTPLKPLFEGVWQ